MKKTMAIILSAVMLLCVIPFSGLAAEVTLDPAASAYAEYDRYAVSSGDAEYIDSLSYDQIASVILDWVDRKIAEVTADFETFEVDAFGTTIAVEIPEITGIDDIIAYSGYLTELGGDFANLDTTNLTSLSRANGDVNFIYGMLQFMADNAATFGKVFHWEEGKVFDYGAVGDYIEGLDTTDADNAKIVDFYNNYLIGNDIQEKFIAEVAAEMGYTIPTNEDGTRAETFDQTISNGIIAWFSGLCETNGILSAEGLEALRAYDLRTTDIYTLVKNFVALVQSDNQVKLDTYYNYLLDTVVRTMLKTMLGQTAAVGETATMTLAQEAFEATYTDLALLEEISGGTAYFRDDDGNYWQATISGGAVTEFRNLTWTQTLDINFEAPTATVYTGANTDEVVQVYRPTSKDNIAVNTYATAKNQDLIGTDSGLTFAGTEVPADYAALMVDANAKALADSFGLTVAQGEEIISELAVTFKEIEEYAEAKGLEAANTVAAQYNLTVSSVDVVLSYNGWATEDEFIAEVVLDSATVNVENLPTFPGVDIQGMIDSAAESAVASAIDTPVATIVVDGLSGNLNIDDAKALLDFIDTDFVIDEEPIAFTANYDTYDGVVGQVNHVLYGIVDMLVSDAGMEKLNLVDGDNNNLTANLQKICDTANDMMAAAEEVMNDEGLQDMLGEIGLDVSALLGDLDLDLLYTIDFSSVEALYVSAISLGLDLIDDNTNTTVTEIHTALDGLTNLDAMAVAITDYVLGKCIPAANEALAAKGLALTVPAATDAAAVADGEGKDIIMTKLVDVAYEAVTWAVDELLNGIANDFIASVNGEAGTDLPEVKFAFGVAKGADWNATLTAMVNRIYELADGIIIACGDYQDAATFDKISAVANAVLPLGSLASNCASDEFAFDVDTVLNTYIFADGLEGDLDGFLGLFETKTKTEDVAADVPVTKALINASQHIVDSIFPGTVVADNYAASETVKEDFTSGDNDVVIAANNMNSINDRKTHLVPAALGLVREAGILPYFAACKHEGATETVAAVAAKCGVAGSTEGTKCADCGYVISGCEEIAALTCSFTKWTTKTAATCTAKGAEISYCDNGCGASKTREVAKLAHTYTGAATAATCTAQGYTTYTCSCGDSYVADYVAATGHADADGNYVCDTCGAELEKPQEELGFFARIKAFFQRIIDWFKNLFK